MDKFKIGQSVYFITDKQILINGIITGFTDYSSGRNPIVTLENSSTDGWSQVVLTENLQARCATEKQ